MTESSPQPAFSFQELKVLASAKLSRHEGTAALYASEEHARDLVAGADEVGGQIGHDVRGRDVVGTKDEREQDNVHADACAIGATTS
jgi:hypothetical protein